MKLSHHESLGWGGRDRTGRVPKKAEPISEKVGCSLSELLVAGEEYGEAGAIIPCRSAAGQIPAGAASEARVGDWLLSWVILQVLVVRPSQQHE